jgi:magnesium transporter
VAAAECWVDLLDPTADEIGNHLPESIHAPALTQLLAPAQHGDEPRPKLESHGDYIFGVLLVAVAVPDEDLVYYQELDLVLTESTLITVRKTPSGEREPYDPSGVRDGASADTAPGMVVYHLVDDVSERYLDLVDALNDEIEELEDHVDSLGSEAVHRRISDLRHDMLHIRRTLAPTRDAVRQVLDDRVELTEGEVFTHDVELGFGSVYDKLLRATEGLELARDLVAGVRDYHQAMIANNQNEVMKRLTVIASVLLVPTFIVGLYGQNFKHMPELRWGWGYGWSWGLIVATTVIQLAFYRWKRWI